MYTVYVMIHITRYYKVKWEDMFCDHSTPAPLRLHSFFLQWNLTLFFLHSFFGFVLFFVLGHTHGIWKLPGARD